MDSAQKNDRVNSTQRNGIQRKGTGGQRSEEWDQRKGMGWTALRGMGYRRRERGGQHSKEWVQRKC